MTRSRGVDVYEVVVGGETLVVTSVPLAASSKVGALTEAERAVALDVVAGLSNRAIARKRKRAERTIANQLASIYRKLGVASRTELAIVVLGDAP